MCQSDATPDNPIRGRLNSWFFQTFDNYIHHLIADHKSRLFTDLPDRVVEIGAGVGANFRYLRRNTHVTAIEPNPHMLPGLKKQAAIYDMKLEVLQCSAQDIPLPDNSVDAAICTLVLCTVPGPTIALNEIRRILKPGGRFFFLEHIAGASRLMAPPNSRFRPPPMALRVRRLPYKSADRGTDSSCQFFQRRSESL